MPDTTLSLQTPSEENEADLSSQAAQLEALLPQILRRLFTLEPDHPVAEMPIAQLRACTILMSGPRSMSVLSEEMGISVSAMTQIADRMERSGLVERIIGQEDRRQKRLQLTDYGSGLMYARRELRVQRASAALSVLAPHQREETLKSLRALLSAAHAADLPDPPDNSLGTRQEQG